MKLNPNEIYHEATRHGLRLIPRGDKLEVTPKSRLTPEFAAVLRENKAELLAVLAVSERDLPFYYASWLHTAKQILAGEFDGADNLTVASLIIGLRGVINPQCQSALARLELEKADTHKK